MTSPRPSSPPTATRSQSEKLRTGNAESTTPALSQAQKMPSPPRGLNSRMCPALVSPFSMTTDALLLPPSRGDSPQYVSSRHKPSLQTSPYKCIHLRFVPTQVA
ncbi:unnamed protein product [Chondrus crispus]|uniref:Uncharacterized protein n=1 Tax=Chondrus crispus TaxID=2769 RepID=R7QG44_CHOCR|nr:unnamed protein product [Chondrus crispus]CDF37034.1 unnamed protein product [Chondrus crispus]|eukprot:XP_005716853.1 unnamed protein product [Chondrus crispus]